jgi:iron(III) transport system permease protein
MSATASPATSPPSARPARVRSGRRALISIVTWAICLLLLGPFLVYPVLRVMLGAIMVDGKLQLNQLLLPWTDPFHRVAMRNSLVIGFTVTVISSLIALPLAYAGARLRFAGKSLLTGLLLVPMLLPPLVGAVGLKQLLAREGLINTLLRMLHLRHEPIAFLQMSIPMIILVASLHLYPLIYLNVAAAWANVDTSLEEAAENQGASAWRVFRTVTLPLLLPGYLAGALIVFIFAFTDLGTPLVFTFNNVVAVQIFNAKTDVHSSLGYVLAFWMTVMAAVIFWVSRRYLEGGRIATLARGTRRSGEQQAAAWQAVLIYLYFGIVILLALLPHIGVILSSFAHDWTSRLLPQWSVENYVRIFGEDADIAEQSIKVSLLCAALSMVIDVVAGFALAYALVRGKVWGRGLLDTVAMIPLALPGLILAFGLLVSYIGTRLDPIEYSAIPLLVISYAVRRLPYALRAVSAGLQQMSVTLEEASLNFGATPLQTVWNVTRPLVMANLIAAGLLTFAFAVLEVSDSLILALDRDNSPIAKAILELTTAVSGGNYVACALGVIGMGLLTVTFLVANRLLGKQLGALFRA